MRALRLLSVVLLFIILLVVGYGFIKIVPVLPVEIPAETPTPPTTETQVAQAEEPAAESTAAVETGQTSAAAAIEGAGAGTEENLPHGLIPAFFIPLLIISLPWIALQLIIIRYVQPRGVDLSEVRIKAQDGLFIEAAISVTARRTLTLASTRMTWPRVKDFVEKTIEQELIHEALQFPTLIELEQNLKSITENFRNLQIIKELSRDFGVDVLRFNVEARYPQETMDALNRKAEASAGGAAYLAYAAAAHLDPDTPECRQLYKIYQETSGQVDAARNLGGGISGLANALGQRTKQDIGKEDGADN